MAKIRSSSVRRRGLLARFRSPAQIHQNTTAQLQRDLTTALAKSVCPSPEAIDRFAAQLLNDNLYTNPLPASLHQKFDECTKQLNRAALAPLYAPPEIPEHDPLAAHDARNQMRAQLEYLSNEEEHLAAWRNQLRDILRLSLPTDTRHQSAAGTVSITVPLHTLFADPTAAIDAIVRHIFTLAPDPAVPALRPGHHPANVVIANVLAISRLTYEDAQKRPYRITWPADAKLSPAELVDRYLANTPLASLLKASVQITIPDELLTEGLIVIASPGHGKTQLMQHMVMRFLQRPNAPTLILMDSQGDALQSIPKLKLLEQPDDDRVIIIDPTDPHPPASNIFAFDRQFAATLPQQQREEFLAGVIETFEFVASGLMGAALTPHMTLAFRFLSQLLLQLENPTLHTFADLLNDPGPYWPYVQALPPTAQSFIEQLYDERSQYKQTRSAILARAYYLLANPAFERMFAHPENKLNLRTAMQSGKLICINTAKAQLKTEASAVFGRFWIAQILQATMARAFIPRQQRRLTVCLVDEAHEYCDPSVELLLYQARKYRVAFGQITQSMAQFKKAGLLEAALSVPAVRFIGAVGDTDANMLAKEMSTTSDFLKSVRKTSNSAEWTVHARNITPTACKTTINFFEAERAPKMTEAAYQQLLQRNRQRVGAPRSTHTPPPVPPQTRQPRLQIMTATVTDEELIDGTATTDLSA